MSTALVTCAGGFQGFGLVRALRDAGDVQVLACDIHADSPTRYACHDYFVCPPIADLDAFTRFLLAMVAARHVDFVFPATAFELTALAQLQPRLRALGAVAAVAPQPLLDALLDKRATRSFLAKSALPAEASLDPHSHDYRFPLIGKPRRGWGGRGTVVLASHDSAHATLDFLDVDAYAWSRRFDSFDEYSADFALGAHGTRSAIVVRRRTRTSGGFAVISESVHSADLEALFERLAVALAHAGGCGCFNAQIIAPRDAEVAPFISDINPRLGTSATHALAEGINLPGFFMASFRDDDATLSREARNRSVKSVRLLGTLALPRLPRRPHGLVLDLDDTLVDHKRWLLAKMQRLHSACFRDRVSPNDWNLAVAQLIDERDWPKLIDRTLELLSLPASLREPAIKAYRGIEVPTPLFDDVAASLTALSNARIRLAILTDNPSATQRAKLAHAPGLDVIPHIVFAREHGGEKPNPRAFDAAAEALSLPAAELMMIGDSWFRDGAGAVRAGYAGALVVRRHALTAGAERWRASAVRPDVAARIHVIPDLVCARHICLDAPR